ncbi:MAG TPA: 4'-phosphopantetheinyl transferase superfamily protein [Solirubrobacterales bacterium]|nr:4'-phosphopantetheinyl transferase superfamily protein [Solirubrobacterales bacterium]
MLERILPAGATVVATREDRDAALYPQEEAAVGRAVEKRRREFVTARACAREALAQLGRPPAAIPSGSRGEPLWPAGIVGSITHCDGYRACAVARAEDLIALGVDAEPNQPLPDGLLADIALPAEREWLRDLGRQMPETHWDRLLFSIKESVYKAWFPLAERWLGFEDATVEVDRRQGSFSARLLVPGPPVGGRELRGFRGRWLVADGLVLAAIALPATGAGPAATAA